MIRAGKAFDCVDLYHARGLGHKREPSGEKVGGYLFTPATRRDNGGRVDRHNSQ
jgi:hypothetical protein